MDRKETIVISLGGSLIVPNEIDSDFVLEFVSLIKDYVNKGFKFIIITGGGKICRKYNESLKKITNPSKDNLDWMGIATTRLNSEFVRIAFGDLAYEKVVLDPDIIPITDKPVILSTGMAEEEEIEIAVKCFDIKKLILLHCISEYRNT